MVKVKYRDLSVSRKIKDRIKFVFQTRLFKISFVIFLIGIVMIVASYQLQGTYYYHNNSSQNVALNSSNPQVINFSQLAGAPMNITFKLPNGESLHYTIYNEVHVTRNGQNIVLKTTLMSGTASNNTVTKIGTNYDPQYYYMSLTTNSNTSYNVIVNAVQSVPKHIPSNTYLGIPGGTIMVIGAISLAISITRIFKS